MLFHKFQKVPQFILNVPGFQSVKLPPNKYVNVSPGLWDRNRSGGIWRRLVVVCFSRAGGAPAGHEPPMTSSKLFYLKVLATMRGGSRDEWRVGGRTHPLLPSPSAWCRPPPRWASWGRAPARRRGTPPSSRTPARPRTPPWRHRRRRPRYRQHQRYGGVVMDRGICRRPTTPWPCWDSAHSSSDSAHSSSLPPSAWWIMEVWIVEYADFQLFIHYSLNVF